jgi:single-stranded DNA-binding protein
MDTKGIVKDRYIIKQKRVSFIKPLSKGAKFSISISGKDKKTEGWEHFNIDCVCWDQPAGYLLDNVKDGDLINAEGRLGINVWYNRNNEKKVSLQFIPEWIELAERRQPNAFSKEAPSNVKEIVENIQAGNAPQFKGDDVTW